MSLSWIFSSSSSNSSSSSTVTSSSSLIQSPSSTNTPAKFNYATLMSSSTSLAMISAVVAGSVGIGFAAWRWLTSSDIPLSMRIKLGILRYIGAVLHRFLITWPSSKDINICHWDIVVDESDDIGHRGDESDSQSNSKSESDSNSELDSESSATKRTHHVIVVVPKVDGDSSVDYSRIYINWHGGGFAGGFAKDDIEFCGRMVTELKCVAVLCTYRFAPENPYPAGFNDCVAVFRWFRKRYPQATITVGGFSAGGTLALNVAYKFHKDIAAVIAFYPPMNFSDESDNDFSEKNPYIRCVFHEAYLRHLPQTDSSKSLLKDPCLSPSYATSDTLPPHVALIAAEIDPNTRDMKKFMDEMERARPPRNDNDNDNHNDNHNNNNHNNDSQQSGAVTATSHFLSGNHSLTINKSFSGKVFKKTMHGWANLPDWILLNFLAKARAEAFAMAISTIAKGFATHSESQ